MAKNDWGNSLQIGEDLEFQRVSWIAHRVGWFVMLLLVIGALAGLFGRGPLSNAHVANQSLAVTYDRFLRLQAPSEVVVSIFNMESLSKPLELFVSREYLKRFQMEKVIPEPSSVEFAGEYLIYKFNFGKDVKSNEVTFQLKPSRFGLVSGKFRGRAEDSLTIEQFVYP